MQESVTESLSRYIDGDLDPSEVEALEARLESDPELRRELDGLSRVRAALRSYAEGEEPPSELDSLVDPLLRGRPGRSASRVWVRWLATAAAVVLGVTVILEVQRRSPSETMRNWQDVALEQAADRPEPFSLAPLPTSTVPEQERPVGAVDHLVAEPAPEIEPSTDPDPALEVLGPLESAEEAARTRGRGEAGGDDKAAPRGKSDAPTLADEGAFGAAPETGAHRKGARPVAEAPVPTAQIFVFMDAKTAWRSFEPHSPCEAGRYTIRIRVQDGLVREVWPVANPPAPSRQVRASQLVLGLEIEGVPDGQYTAEVVVEPKRRTTR